MPVITSTELEAEALSRKIPVEEFILMFVKALDKQLKYVGDWKLKDYRLWYNDFERVIELDFWRYDDVICSISPWKYINRQDTRISIIEPIMDYDPTRVESKIRRFVSDVFTSLGC